MARALSASGSQLRICLNMFRCWDFTGQHHAVGFSKYVILYTVCVIICVADFISDCIYIYIHTIMSTFKFFGP